ncbi:MAG: hypothetical protein M1840_002132 [Geoglossum simile]|nr:MAG: hypothetical protein M1840_002132 [Geoglossum simile]
MRFGSQRVCTHLVLHTSLGLQVDVVDWNTGYTPLHFAIREGWIEFFGALVQRGTKLDFRGQYPENHYLAESQSTYLHVCAAMKSAKHFVEVMILNDIHIGMPDKYGRTPLFISIRNDAIDIARILLQHGENLNQPLQDGFTLLGQLLRRKNRKMVNNLERAIDNVCQLAQELGVSLNPVVHEGRELTALHMAAGLLFEEEQSQRVFQVLLFTLGLEVVNRASKRGSYPIHEAITMLNTPAIKELLRSNADLDVKDPDGNDILEITRVLVFGVSQEAAEQKQFAGQLARCAQHMLDILENAKDWPNSIEFFERVRGLENQLEPLIEASIIINHADPRRRDIYDMVANACRSNIPVLTDWLEVYEFGRHINKTINGHLVLAEEDMQKVYELHPWIAGTANLDKDEALFANIAKRRSGGNFPYPQVMVTYPSRLAGDWNYALGDDRRFEQSDRFLRELEAWDKLQKDGSLAPIEFSQEFRDFHFKPPVQKTELSATTCIKPVFQWSLYCSCVDRPFDAFPDDFISNIVRRSNRDGAEAPTENYQARHLREADRCFYETHYFTIDMPPPTARPGFEFEGIPRQHFLCGIEDEDD